MCSVWRNPTAQGCRDVYELAKQYLSSFSRKGSGVIGSHRWSTALDVIVYKRADDLE